MRQATIKYWRACLAICLCLAACLAFLYLQARFAWTRSQDSKPAKRSLVFFPDADVPSNVAKGTHSGIARHRVAVSRPGAAPYAASSSEAEDVLIRDYHSLLKYDSQELGKPAWTAAARLERRDGKQYNYGVVIAAGKALRLGNVYVTLMVLRHHLKSKMPVEIWHLGPKELDNNTQTFFEANFTNVRCIDAAQVAQPDHQGPSASLSGYALKAFALYATSFDNVLLLDSDCLPTVDPMTLFHSTSFRAHGNMFWPDLFGKGTEVVPGVQPHLYQLFGLRLPWEGLEDSFMWAESGQVFFDRVAHRDVLEYVWFLNAHKDPVYKLAYGDKDTFLLAFLLAGKGQLYNQIGEWVRLCVGQPSKDSSAKLEHVGLLHHAPDGNVAFLHRTAGGKLDPHRNAFLTADFVTLPLHPRRAQRLFEGTGEPTNYRFPRIRLRHDSNLTSRPFQVCARPQQEAISQGCETDGRLDLPVPVISARQLGEPSTGSPLLAQVLNASYRAFEGLRAQLKQANNTFLVGVEWLR